MLVGCASSPLPAGDSTASAPASTGTPMAGQNFAETADVAAAPVVAEVPRLLPQMIKTADITVVVDAVDESLQRATAIAQQQQGDILGLQNQTPPNDYYRHTASLQMRVPQERLELTLEALGELGTVQRQSITAEDVSTQLVDFQARLRNLRKSEEMLLQIMERSGDLGEVLKVAQELSTIRNSVEQIDAQLSSLQNRVAYSTINLSLEGAIADAPAQRALGIQLRETWESASHSMGKLTVDFIQLSIWLAVYSPYLLIFAGATVWGYRHLKQQRSHSAPATSEATTRNT
ncbi:DUF4349 domain-containing protein [Leptolyngbya sp. FACHB-671]|uniref:DUF4349 domain-containing protein n=1 Tax=Leptolyngbya sp. FACHB-671 TaxID=2692812 RepID=UPI0016831D3C|nr:DUF4349 domain-containing protein [Leptolyngbya sp. FACHB-671]MBD1871755.1 DUF4349 domain-containing protein [Cyanobacteria bacterium FACHB-471]MBD2069765.1 DUF4349 domain-containing protein [Leptolyngbya sp. FACHB-671]